MPFKDINYENLVEANRVERKLKTQIGIINKANSKDLTAREKVATVELLPGKKIQPTLSPIEQLLSQQEAEKTLAPITSGIAEVKKAIQQIPQNNDNVLALAGFEALPPPLQPAQQAVEAPGDSRHLQQGVDLYERFIETDDLRNYFKTNAHMYGNLNELALQNDQERIRGLIDRMTTETKSLGGRKGYLSRRSDLTEEQKATQREQLDVNIKLANYWKKILQKLKVGSGVVTVGNYSIPVKRLNKDNVLSVRYKKTNKMVPAFGSTKVSDGVKNKILGYGTTSPLSKGETAFLDKLYKNSIGKKVGQHVCDQLPVFTSMDQVREKARVLLGELAAGNTSVTAKNELSNLLHHLYKSKQLSKSDYTNLIKGIENEYN